MALLSPLYGIPLWSPVGRNDSDFLNAGTLDPRRGYLRAERQPMSREYVIHVNVKRKVARCIGRYARDVTLIATPVGRP